MLRVSLGERMDNIRKSALIIALAAGLVFLIAAFIELSKDAPALLGIIYIFVALPMLIFITLQWFFLEWKIRYG